jgi:hypothetical protein
MAACSLLTGENNLTQIFSPDGEFLTQWIDLARPCDLCIDADEVVYVPELDALITILTLDGKVLSRWTSPTGTGQGDGGHAVWVDSHGDIYMNQNQEGRRLLTDIRELSMNQLEFRCGSA